MVIINHLSGIASSVSTEMFSQKVLPSRETPTVSLVISNFHQRRKPLGGIEPTTSDH